MDPSACNGRFGRSLSGPARRAAWLAAFALVVAADAGAQDVKSLACSPAVIAGGSGAASTCTLTLAAPAPAAGTAVALKSSLPALAASVGTARVPGGQSTASFTVATNPDYRRFSGLAFSAVVSASTTTTASATLDVTAQTRPGPFVSGVAPGQRFQWQGAICGGMPPIGNQAGILFQCSAATRTQFGSCTVGQECSIGCRRLPPNGVVFNDVCAASGPNPVALSRNLAVSGDRVPASIVAEGPVAAGKLTQGLPSPVSTQNRPGAINGINADASVFPHDGGITIPTGADRVGFDLATSYVPQTTFVDVRASWSDAGSVTITSGRSGQSWLTIVPPDPPPALPLPTLGAFTITGTNPVSGGSTTFGQLDTSGITSGGGPTIHLTSSNPGVAAVPDTFVMPAQPILGSQVFIATSNPDVDTPVTITATDGRYTFSAALTVLAHQAPLLSALAVAPSHAVGGSGVTGTITLARPAPAGGALVALSTLLPAVAQLPAGVTVPAGATTASFAIATQPVASTFNVNVFADLQGTERNAVLIVTPGGVASVFGALGVTPSDIVGAGTSQGFVGLAFPAPAGGAAIALASDSPAVSVPPSVVVPENDSGAYFDVVSRAVDAKTAVTLTATYAGIADSVPLTVSPPPSAFTLTLNASGRNGERVTSTPAGISAAVGTSQAAPFAPGTAVTLAASNGRDAIWSGGCSSGGKKARSCTLTVNANVTVNAAVQ